MPCTTRTAKEGQATLCFAHRVLVLYLKSRWFDPALGVFKDSISWLRKALLTMHPVQHTRTRPPMHANKMTHQYDAAHVLRMDNSVQPA